LRALPGGHKQCEVVDHEGGGGLANGWMGGFEMFGGLLAVAQMRQVGNVLVFHMLTVHAA